jgi:hypothetical protein
MLRENSKAGCPEERRVAKQSTGAEQFVVVKKCL